jgi:hypothetical protein
MNTYQKSIARLALAILVDGMWHSPGNQAMAQEPAIKPLPIALPSLASDELSAAFRAGVLKQLPKDLVIEVNDNWGHQAEIVSIQGLRLIHVKRNHGNWEKAHVTARDLPKQLSLRLGEVGELYSIADNRVAFTIHLTTPAQVELQKETWQNGLLVHTRKVRARFQLSADITMEASLNEAGAKKPMAEKELLLQIVRANYSCKKFLIEDVNGIGGDLARLGNGLEKTFKPWQPAALLEIQKSLNGAIAAAGADRETQNGLRKLVVEAAVARAAILRTQPAGGADTVVPPAFAFVPVQLPPLFPYVGAVSFEIMLPIRVDRHEPRMWAPVERPSHVEHAFADHSIHYEHTSHAAPSSSHHEAVRKK